MDTLTLQAGPAIGGPVVLPDAADAPLLVARRASFPTGGHIAAHQHVRGQFLFAIEGAMFVRTPHYAWLVPPSRALWIPAGIEHAIDAYGELHMRTLYLNAASAASLPAHCVVMEVTALLRELILRMTSVSDGVANEETIELISRLAILEISQLSHCRLELPLPRSADLQDLCEAILERPSLTSSPTHVADSARTLYRRFRAETGLSFVQWRKQACLLQAVRMMSEGLPVTHVALELGYESPSAFSTMFRRMLGVSPRAFLAGD